jgi:hypothetical protein
MGTMNVMDRVRDRCGRIPTPWAVGFSAAVFFVFFTASSLEFHAARSNDPRTSILKGDASGYYIYLPALFRHGMKVGTQTDSARAMHDSGYKLDRVHDRVITKYTYGTALFHLPFYLIAEFLAGGDERDEWSVTHQQAIAVAGIFYWTSGLLFLGLALRRRWSPSAGLLILVLGCVAFGTNSFYYAFRQPGYSHMVSFFLSSLSLFAIWNGPPGALRPTMLLLFAFACAALVVVRPFDAVLSLGLMGLLFVERPVMVRTWRTWTMMAAAFILLLVPQMMYWYHAQGRYLLYSYGDEGFRNWARPFLAEVLMSPTNGLVPHAPVLFFVPFGLLALWYRSRGIVVVLVVVICAALYGFAAWHAWHFGCSYGMRPFIEYVPLAAIALLGLFMWLRSRAAPVLHGLVPLLVLLCFVNYRAMLEYQTWVPYGENLIEAFFGGVDFNMTRR